MARKLTVDGLRAAALDRIDRARQELGLYDLTKDEKAEALSGFVVLEYINGAVDELRALGQVVIEGRCSD